MIYRLKTSILLGLAACLILSFSACLKDECTGTQTYIQYEPIYITYEEMRNNVKVVEAQEIQNPGKINYYNNHIIVNEIEKGIHIINNNNPSNPVNVSFIEIAGNVDFAVKEGMLYADNYIDLVVFDITNISQPNKVTRVENVFNFYSYNADLGLFVGYHQTDITSEIDCQDPRWISPYYYYDDFLFASDVDVAVNLSPSSTISNVPSSNAPSAGTAGSLSRFAIADCNLYCIDENNIDVYDVSTISQPSFVNEVSVDWGIETLFPYGEYLFVGAQTGMYIYDNTVPSNPTFISNYEHFQACDPVFVSGRYAYVTLRDGTACAGFDNQLDIIDIIDIFNPSLVRSYELNHPGGLSIKDETLYICDGDAGLKVFDLLAGGTEINEIDKIRGINAYDVINIPNSDVLLVSALDGIYQYDISNTSSLNQLSVIQKAQ